jgi:AraC-like DNA-binding protein
MPKKISLLTRREYFPNGRMRVAVHREVPQYPMSPHRHEFFEIAIILSGSGVHVADRFRHRIEAQDVLVLHRRRTHSYEKTIDLNLVNILIREDLVNRLGRDLGNLRGYHSLFTLGSARLSRGNYVSYIRLSSAELKQVEEWTSRLEEETLQDSRESAVLAEAYLTLIVSLLCRRYGKTTGLPSRPEGKLGPVLSWIEKRLASPLTVADVAREMKMSERSLHRRFRLMTGTTPAAYLAQARIRRAADHLSRENWQGLRISEIATACGFEDSNYFSRCFRKVMRQTPRAYQKAFQTRSSA